MVLMASLDAVLRATLGVICRESLDVTLMASLGAVLRGSVIVILGVVKGVLTSVGLVMRASCDPVRMGLVGVITGCGPARIHGCGLEGSMSASCRNHRCDLERSSGCGPLEALGVVHWKH